MEDEVTIEEADQYFQLYQSFQKKWLNEKRGNIVKQEIRRSSDHFQGSGKRVQTYSKHVHNIQRYRAPFWTIFFFIISALCFKELVFSLDLCRNARYSLGNTLIMSVIFKLVPQTNRQYQNLCNTATHQSKPLNISAILLSEKMSQARP